MANSGHYKNIVPAPVAAHTHKWDWNAYADADARCQRAMELALRLKEEDVYRVTSVYTSLCLNLVSELQYLILTRLEKVQPYLESLSGKVAEGHDCMNCSGKCAISHGSMVREIADSHYHTTEVFNRLNKIAIPLYSDETALDSYKLLRREMEDLYLLTHRLFFREEAELIPQILEKQKKIHASD